MSRSTPKRALSALTLAILLSLPTAPALAGPVGLPGAHAFPRLGKAIEGLLDWAFGWWMADRPQPHPAAPFADPTRPERRADKEGPMIDPLGGPTSSASTCGEEGPMIDPLGACGH